MGKFIKEWILSSRLQDSVQNIFSGVGGKIMSQFGIPKMEIKVLACERNSRKAILTTPAPALVDYHIKK